MHENDHLTPAETELERALGRLTPADPGLDRDRLMFLAGQAAGRRERRRWQAAVIGLAAALAFAMGLASWRTDHLPATPSVPGGPAIVHQTSSAEEDPSSAVPPGMAYLRLRDAVLDEGLDALPAVKSSGQAIPVRQPLLPGA